MKHITSILLLLLLLSSCKQKCHNGIQDPGEEGVDCGGKCWSCYIDPDPSVCENTPDLFGKLYCVHPDTTGFSVQAPPDTSIGPQFFMMTYISTNQLLTLCNGTYANENYNALEPDIFHQFSRFSMIEDTQNGGYDYTFIESTYWRYTDKCHYYIPTILGQPCDWFSSGYTARYYFYDMTDSIYVITQPVNLNSSISDTLTYYLIN